MHRRPQRGQNSQRPYHDRGGKPQCTPELPQLNHLLHGTLQRQRLNVFEGTRLVPLQWSRRNHGGDDRPGRENARGIACDARGADAIPLRCSSTCASPSSSSRSPSATTTCRDARRPSRRVPGRFRRGGTAPAHLHRRSSEAPRCTSGRPSKHLTLEATTQETRATHAAARPVHRGPGLHHSTCPKYSCKASTRSPASRCHQHAG